MKFRVVPCLTVLVLLVLLLAERPVRAQSPAVPLSAGEIWMQFSPAGRVALERRGPMIRARLRLPLASVPPVIPATSSYLLTVPQPFRPAETVHGTVAFHPVAADGTRTAAPAEPLYLHFWVEPHGAVYYQPLDEVPRTAGAAPVWVEGMWLWPGAGTQPQVCQRHAEVRHAIQNGLRARKIYVSCERITWSHLASLRYLESYLRVTSVADVHGLSGLRGTDLDLDLAPSPAAVSAVLAHLPQLTRLELYAPVWEAEPAHWLSQTPNLRQLGFRFPSATPPPPAAYPERLLAHAPRLTHLQFHMDLPVWPPGFLVDTRGLTHLRIGSLSLTELPDDFLSHTPQLTHLQMQVPQLRALPPHFLAYAPRLEDLHLAALGAGVRLWTELSTVPASFLTATPRLVRLRLDQTRLTTLPAGFLSHTPQLVEARLWLPELKSLPAGFLFHTPQLARLDLDLSAVGSTTLPAEFLGHLPVLQDVRLWMGAVTALPPTFLQRSPHLAALHLWLPQLAPPLAPGDPLWALLRRYSRVVVAGDHGADLYFHPRQGDLVAQTVPPGRELEVVSRHRDEGGREWLQIQLLMSSLWVPADQTEPTVQVRSIRWLIGEGAG